jgi:hypothetical protein
MQCSFDRLDGSTQDYLRQIWQTKGKEDNGIFVPHEPGPPPWASGWFLLTAVFVGIVFVITRPTPFSLVHLGMQAALGALAWLFFVWGVQIFWRRLIQARTMGRFTYVDALYIWESWDGNVTITPLDIAIAAAGKHYFANQFYLRSVIEVHVPGNSRVINVSNQALAGRLVDFVNALVMLRQPNAEGQTVTDPRVLGALAMQLSQGQPSGDPEKLNLGRPIPSPYSGAITKPLGWSRRRALAPWMSAAAVGAAAWFGFLLVNDHLLFQRARESAQRQHDPGRLREYLADPRNAWHREEARTLINPYYDEAIALVRKLIERKKTVPIREALEGPVLDPNLSAGLLVLLEALKTNARSTITVGFDGKEDPVPVTPEQKFVEQQVYLARLQEEKELNNIANTSGDHTAILPHGPVFDKTQTARREEIILNQLESALQKVLKYDILSLEPVPPGEKALLEVAYHTYPSGDLYLYTESDPTSPTPRKVKGLLRGYTSKWTITIRPPGGEERVCQLNSHPATELKQDRMPGDPDWAPTAIILFSSFNDMAARLVAGFGLDADLPPASYTFEKATGKMK